MIRTLQNKDRKQIYNLLVATKNFTDEELKVAMELVDIYLNNPAQKDYLIFVYADDSDKVNGYVCIGPRPLTTGTYDLYWIAVDPACQAKGIGSALISFVENYLKQKSARLILIETSGKPSYQKERNFYEKNSYEKFCEIKDFYNIGDSLIIYGKYI
jgi:ribosomal protein S18 acetylase RimI-like enzyme